MQAAPELPRALLLDEPWSGWAAIATQLGVDGIITDAVDRFGPAIR
jgi:glycerophosphoryl diester phosphodiesterase